MLLIHKDRRDAQQRLPEGSMEEAVLAGFRTQVQFATFEAVRQSSTPTNHSSDRCDASLKIHPAAELNKSTNMHLVEHLL